MNSTVAMPSRVVIVGGGFAGLYAAKALRKARAEVRTGTRMVAIDDDGVTLKRGETIEEVHAHIGYLIEFDSKVMVMFQWGWNYLTRKKGARLVTGGNFATRLHVGPGRRG